MNTGKKGDKQGDFDINQLGKLIFSRIHLPGTRRESAVFTKPDPGTSPGIEHRPEIKISPKEGAIPIQLIHYSEVKHESQSINNIEELLNRGETERDHAGITWINIDGLNPYIVNQLKEHFGFHTLAAEDVLNVPQRPKIEVFDDHLFIVFRMLRLKNQSLVNEQVSLFCYKNTLISIQETCGDIWDPIRNRIARENSRLRQNSTDYLLYALLDATVDHFFPILEHYGSELEEIEEIINHSPVESTQRRLHGIKRELSILRRVMWPTREMVDQLFRDDSDLIDPKTRTYLHDVYDHAIQVIDLNETYREIAGGLTDLYQSMISNRMNEVMKILTIMASLFIPITFLAGVYGMNFEYIPELSFRYAYPIFWTICLSVTVTLVIYFRRKGWFN